MTTKAFDLVIETPKQTVHTDHLTCNLQGLLGADA